MSIIVLSKPACQPCVATYRALDKAGLVYTPTDITTDPDALALAVSLGHQQSPVVIVRDDAGEITEHWSGFRPDRLKALSA